MVVGFGDSTSQRQETVPRVHNSLRSDQTTHHGHTLPTSTLSAVDAISLLCNDVTNFVINSRHCRSNLLSTENETLFARQALQEMTRTGRCFSRGTEYLL
eukprot:gb/GECG01012852.1/.p1 GENE.gb/GECG01012852.1/~~gb/GECG01012852.1/.p1  ORF type:complete len:100 (+),score=6.84 gb/GECG01012852.1/:1-300(+)